MSPSSDVSNKGWICKLCCSKFRRSSKVKQMNKGKAKNDPNILFQSTISSKSVNDLNPFSVSDNRVNSDYSKKAQKAKTFSLFCPKYYNCVDVRNTYGGSALEGGTSIDKKLCGSLGWFLFPNKSQIQNEVQSKRTSPITNNTCDTVISKNTSEIHQNWETHKNPFGIECREGSLISKGPNDLPVSVREQFNDDRVMKCGFPCKFSPETTKISFPQHTIPAKDACLSNFSTNCGLNSLPAAREIVGDPKRQINGFHPFNRSPTLKQGLNNTNMRGTTKLYDYQELDMNNCMNGDANINGDKQIKNEYGENGTNPDTKVGDIVFKERVPEDLKNKDIFNYPADDTCEFSQVFENDGSAFGRFALFSRLCDKYKTINRRFTLKRTMKKKRKRRKDKSKLKWLARYIDEQLKKKGIIESSISEDLEKSIKIFFIRRFDSEKSSDEIIENNIYNRTSPQKRYVKCSSCGRDTSQSRCWNFTLKTSSFSNTISESKNITSKSDTSEKNINKRTIIEQNNNKRFVDVAVNYELLVSPKADKAVTALISNKTLKIDQYVDTHDIDQYYTNQKYNSRNCNNNIRSKRMCYKKIDFKDVVECFDENKRIVKLKKEQNRLIKNKTHCCLKKTSVTDLTQHRTKRSLLLSKSIPSFFKYTTKDKHNMKPGKNYDCQVLFRNKCHSSDASSHSPSSDDEHNVLFINKLSRSSFYIFITKAVNEDSNIRRSSSEISIRKKCVLNKRILVKSNSYCSRHIYRKENCGTYENYLVAFNYEEDKCSLLKKENNKCKTRDSFNEKHASGSSCLEGCEGVNLKGIRNVIASSSSDPSRYIVYRDIVPDELNSLDLFNIGESPQRESSSKHNIPDNYKNDKNARNPCHDGSQNLKRDTGCGRCRKDGPPKPLPFMKELNEFWKQRQCGLRSYPQLVGDSSPRKENVPESYKEVPYVYGSDAVHHCRCNCNDTEDPMTTAMKEHLLSFVGPCNCPTSRKKMVSPAAPSCTRCGEEVFAAEKIISCGGCFHKNCYVCCMCRRPLSISIVREFQGEVICEYCFLKNFGDGYIFK